MKYIIPLASLLALTLSACGTTPSNEASTAAADSGPLLEMFVMSQCPYGVQVEEAAIPVKQELGNSVRLAIHYIGSGDVGALTSLHGEPEVKGDIAQLCAQAKAPSKFLDFITCQNKNPRAVDTNWVDCGKELGIDEAALKACVEGEEGQKLAAADFKLASERGANGSPTMFLDGKPYMGGRKAKDFKKAWCDAMTGDKPEACNNIPVPPKVEAIFFSDTRCEKCDIAGIEPKLKGELGGLVVKHVDYNTDDGKKLYAELKAASPGFRFLPAILLGPEVEQDKDGMEALQRFLRPLGNYKELQIGGDFDPTAEICDNNVDDDGDGGVDCKDDGCAVQLVCRDEQPKTLEMFVMSQCPYGAKAMIGAQEALGAFGDDMNLKVHFIGDGDAGSLSSMHGPDEVTEDLRELCATKVYPKASQFMAYLSCRSKNYKSMDWEPCAKEAGMEPAKIQACVDGPGKQYLADSFAYAAKLGIGASPTFLGNGKREFNAIAADQIQAEFCKDNPGLKGCTAAVKVDEAAAAMPAGQCN